MTEKEQVGQLFMMGVNSGGLSKGDVDVLAAGKVGSILFLGNSTAGSSAIHRLTDRVRSKAKSPKGVRVMLTVDQEGGLVQRLRGPGFDRIPSARRQALLSDGALARSAKVWGRQLKKAGIDANLAPVADVVPTAWESINQPIGVLHRGYGPDRAVVAAKASAFIAGMNRAGIATSVKHFPGLGRVRGNTDFEAHVVDHSTTRHDRSLAGFRAGVKSGVDMVMVSTAYYAKIDPNHRAAFSKTVLKTMLRKDLGFVGVVISDDLAARAVRDLSPGQRAVQFLNAGGDLIIVGDPRLAPAMIKAVIAKAKADPKFAAAITAKATRVLTMKARRGLADCR
jgi:beta-N-acetylhexosaminidase